MLNNKLKDNEIIKDISFEKKTAYYKKEIKDFFSRYENKSGGEDCTEVCLIRAGYRTVLKAEEEINRLQAELKVSNEALNNSIKLNNRLETQNKELSETIHNLTLEKDALFDKAEELKVEVEKLNKEIQITKDAYTMLQTKIEIINSKAVKEFAEKLKKRIYKGGVHPTVEDEFMCDIDNLVKEMVSEDK